MDTETLKLEKKYSTFTENIKKTLKKAVNRKHFELANAINEYLGIIEELKNVHKLKKKNDVETYRKDIKIYENELKKIQLKIIDIQFSKPVDYDNDKIILDLPKYINDDINFIFMFIYKFIQINSDIICIVLKNIIDDLFNLEILDSTLTYKDFCDSKILENISVVYNKKEKELKYNYRANTKQGSATGKEGTYKEIKKVLDKIMEKLNKYDVNKKLKVYGVELQEDTIKEFKTMLAIILVNILKDVHCTDTIHKDIDGYTFFSQDSEIIRKIYNEYKTGTSSNIIISEKTKKDLLKSDKFKELMINHWENKLTKEEREKYKQKELNKKILTSNKLKTYVCNYVKINPQYKINREYNKLYNYLLTRDTANSEETKINKSDKTNKTEPSLHVIIPEMSLSLVNNIVIFMYLFIKKNKKDICDNVLKLLKNIKETLVKQTYSFHSSGKYLYDSGKILSLCSSSKNAEKLINTFYSKYNSYDKILISNLLLKLIKNDSLKIKYDGSTDKFSAVIINTEDIDIDFTTIDKSKLLEGLNNDLKCINSEINEGFIVQLIGLIRDGLNIIIEMLTNKKIITSIYNLSTDSHKVYSLLKNKELNFKIRKLTIVIFIKFILVHISKFYIDPTTNEYNMYDTIINDIHKHICETLTYEFNYDVFSKIEKIYEEYPVYDV